MRANCLTPLVIRLSILCVSQSVVISDGRTNKVICRGYNSSQGAPGGRGNMTRGLARLAGWWGAVVRCIKQRIYFIACPPRNYIKENEIFAE